MVASKTKRTAKQRALQASSYEKRIQAAIEGKSSGRYRTWKAAAKDNNVATQTLRDRALGIHKSRKDAHAGEQLLTPIQEDVLSDWVRHLGNAANPLDIKGIQNAAYAVTGQYPGKHWYYRYQARQSENSISLARPSGLDPKRAKNFNRANVMDYFDKRQKVIDFCNSIPPEHDWNQDEKGLQLGGGRKGNRRKFLYACSNRDRYRLRSDNLELVTVIECISAAGQVMPPGFILSAGPFPETSEAIGAGCVAVSPSGWVDQELYLHWFEKVFVPEAVSRRVCDKPIVLTVDGHNSHETPEIQQAAYKHNIIIICLPSKTTHKLQPLDVLVFSSVQNSWYSHCDRRLAEGIKMDRYNIIGEYMIARSVITPELVKKAFEKAGIHPHNPAIFTDADYAPSIASSSLAHLPSSYPASTVGASTSATRADEEEDGEDEEEDGEDGEEDGEDEEGNEDGPSEVHLIAPQIPALHLCPRLLPPQIPPISLGPSIVSEVPVPPSSTRMSMSSSHAPSPLSRQASGSEIPFGASAFTPAPSDILPNSQSARTRESDARPVHAVLTEDGHTVTQEHDEGLQGAELVTELRKARMRMEFLEKQALENQVLAEEQAKRAEVAETHCTMARQEISTLRVQLDNQTKKSSRRSTNLKTQARLLTFHELQQSHEEQNARRIEKQKQADERDAQKALDKAARTARITEQTVTRIFDGPLSSYKKKEDLLALAGALKISTDGNVNELSACIKNHVADHQELKHNPRFAGLFNKRRTAAPTAGHQDAMGPPLTVLAHSAVASSPAPSHAALPVLQPTFWPTGGSSLMSSSSSAGPSTTQWVPPPFPATSWLNRSSSPLPPPFALTNHYGFLRSAPPPPSISMSSQEPEFSHLTRANSGKE